MPRPKRSIGSEATVDGYKLVWRLLREQQLIAVDTWTGIALHVQLAEGAHRELILEYPAIRSQKLGYTRMWTVQPTVQPKNVEAHIRQAIAAGWVPDSRGSKPFVFLVEEPPS
jgi:hypothetical protein